MTPEIIIVLTITFVSVVLFITEKIRVDIVALMVLVGLALTGVITPSDALSGFSSPAVVTVWAILILSGGLARTGVASMLGDRFLSLAKDSEDRLSLIIMLSVGLLSGFMNNIGVASLMLPVVIDAARRLKIPPSRLLIPLAFSAHLGGLITLIGTPPNILISEALRNFGLKPFAMFDYSPTGITALIGGVLFLQFIGRRLLPKRDIGKDSIEPGADIDQLFALEERLFTIKLPTDSSLGGKSLGKSRLGSLIGINIIAVLRGSQKILAPEVDFVLMQGDCLLAGGRIERLMDFMQKRQLIVQDESLPIDILTSEQINLSEISLAPGSNLQGQTLEEISIRKKYGVNVLAIWRDGIPRRTNLQTMYLQSSDVLLIQGAEEALQNLIEDKNFSIASADPSQAYHLNERLLAVSVPTDSELVGKTLNESRLGDAYGLQVLGIQREGKTQLMPLPSEQIIADDILLVEGLPEDLDVLRGLQSLLIEPCDRLEFEGLQSETVGLTEVVLSPHTHLAGKTLRSVHFREKYGLTVLALWREGRPYRSNLRDMPLRFGDAMLVFGKRERLKILGHDPEFLVLTQEAIAPPRSNKALTALLIMAAVLLPVVFGWLPIAISAVMGAVLMILTGCLTPDEAYQSIEWRAIFLIAGMLPLGIAMETSGAASLLANSMVGIIGTYGAIPVMAGLFLMAAIASQVMPNPAAAVLLAPIAFNTATDLGISPYPFMMTVAIAASSAFLSPVGHPANVLIMGPGGYKFSDYTKVGIPLTLLILIISLIVVPLVWPF